MHLAAVIRQSAVCKTRGLALEGRTCTRGQADTQRTRQACVCSRWKEGGEETSLLVWMIRERVPRRGRRPGTEGSLLVARVATVREGARKLQTGLSWENKRVRR